ncbi:hypothetical protein AALP_AA3G113500 [Arabis alpina]|uniref:Uncharacterized protein n=1 Tax=Arabis alpina TaxID=50452 RepID=A0A087H8I8_ARAAL|nr:hypothetical protein AALP_AA3G113500 [Arabis alpina]
MAYINIFLINSTDKENIAAEELVRILRRDLHLKTMIVVMTSLTETWTRAGAHTCVKGTWDEDMLVAIFKQLKEGLVNELYREAFKIAIVYEGDIWDHANWFDNETQEVVTAVSESDVDRMEIAYDMIMVYTPTVANQLRIKGFTKLMVGVTSSDKECTDFGNYEVSNFLTPPLTKEKIESVIKLMV